MKIRLPRIIFFLILSSFYSGSIYESSLFAQDRLTIIGVVTRVEGKTYVLHSGDNQFTVLNKGDRVFYFDRIKTLDNSKVVMLFVRGPSVRMRVGENTEISMPKKFTSYRKSTWDIERAGTPVVLETTVSGISIGGYDPLVLNNEIIKKLLEKNRLSKEKVKKIYGSTSIDSFKVHTGIDVLKSTNQMLELLIKEKIITRVEVEKAKTVAKEDDSKVTKIDGYNLVVLDSYIIELLIKKGIINLEEGKSLLRSSRAKKSNLGVGPGAVAG